MALFKTRSAAVYGVDAHIIDVEVDMYLSGSARDSRMVGMPDVAVRESRERGWIGDHRAGQHDALVSEHPDAGVRDEPVCVQISKEHGMKLECRCPAARRNSQKPHLLSSLWHSAYGLQAFGRLGECARVGRIEQFAHAAGRAVRPPSRRTAD